METAGARLKSIRINKGLSLEDVQKQTKVHANLLKAIEEDNYIGLSDIYAKGIIKIYCKFLAVDVKEFVSSPKEPVVKSALKPEAGQSIQISKINPVYIKKLLVIAIAIAVLFGVVKLSAGLISKLRSRAHRAVVFTPPLKKTNKSLPQRKISAVPRVQVRAPMPSVAVNMAKEPQDMIMLGIRTRDDSWMHVKIDGKVVFHALLKKNKTESWKAKEKIELSLGNAGVVDIELNGKAIPPVGKKGQAVKNILITKSEGLVVPR